MDLSVGRRCSVSNINVTGTTCVGPNRRRVDGVDINAYHLLVVQGHLLRLQDHSQVAVERAFADLFQEEVAQQAFVFGRVHAFYLAIELDGAPKIKERPFFRKIFSVSLEVYKNIVKNSVILNFASVWESSWA